MTKKSKAKKKADYEQKGKLFLIILAMLVFTNLVLEFVHNILGDPSGTLSATVLVFAVIGYGIGRLI